MAGAALALVSAPTVWDGPEGSGCNVYLIRTIFTWMLVFGILLLLAEFEVPLVQEHVHILAYRSGRALLMLFMGMVAASAAPAEIPLSYAAPGVTTDRTKVLVNFHWKFAGVGVLLISAALYALRLTAFANIVKIGNRLRSGSAAKKEMV